MNQGKNSDELKEIVADGYDQVVSRYARLEETGDWPRMRWLRKVLACLEPDSAVLDLGCGSGDPADIEIAKDHTVTGVDISREQIELARKHVPAGKFIRDDLASVDFEGASFYAVVSFYTLEHLPRREHAAVLQRIYHWLKPGGFFLLSTEAAEADDVTGEWLGVPMFFSSFGPDTLRLIVEETGFSILESDIESQLEEDTEIPYLWIFAQKPG